MDSSQLKSSLCSSAIFSISTSTSSRDICFTAGWAADPVATDDAVGDDAPAEPAGGGAPFDAPKMADAMLPKMLIAFSSYSSRTRRDQVTPPTPVGTRSSFRHGITPFARLPLSSEAARLQCAADCAASYFALHSLNIEISAPTVLILLSLSAIRMRREQLQGTRRSASTASHP